MILPSTYDLPLLEHISGIFIRAMNISYKITHLLLTLRKLISGNILMKFFILSAAKETV